MRRYWRAWSAASRQDDISGPLAAMLERVTARLAKESGIGFDTLVTSRFFVGYLMGYPECADHGGAGDDLRRRLFGHFYGDGADQLIDISRRHLDSRDVQTARGAGFGVRDGLAYFSERSEGSDGRTATTALRTAFDLGEIDPAARIH